MGMDLYAEDHTPSEGWPKVSGYFRASIWGWRAIAQAIDRALLETGRPQLKNEERMVLNYNDGGLIDSSRAIELADAIDEWLLFDENREMKFVTLHGSNVGDSPEYVIVSLREEDPRGAPKRVKVGDTTVETFSLSSNSTKSGAAWTTDLDHFREFSVFSRQSGGFRVH